jgi:two-component system, NtrC family, sensor kinase
VDIDQPHHYQGEVLPSQKIIMADSDAIEALKERIKELTCLYNISALASTHTDSLNETLQAIVTLIAQSWRYSDKAVAEIKLSDENFKSADLPLKSVSHFEPILIDGEQLGTVRVHYPAPEFGETDFLIEEYQLLKKVAQEIATILDRHNRKAKEEELQRSAQYNQRLSILGEITAGIAHELNTPLGNILGFSQLITESAEKEQTKLDAEKITNSAIYAREIVKKLMFFSSEMPHQKESISFNVLVTDAISMLRPSLANAEINVEFEKDPANAFGRVDPIQITQVIFNLILNAIDASPKNSTISVKLISGNGKMNIIISDQGSGIDVADRPRIFDPFFSTKAFGKGTGLGLSVVHGIIKSHGGSIHFSTEINEGTTFNISLPLQS